MNCRDIARRYAEARKFRRSMREAGFVQTCYALGGYLVALRAQWAFARQQCVSGFNTVEVLGGPFVVRVHEALGYWGCTKSEATRDAKAEFGEAVTL